MASYEHKGQLNYVDYDGNEHILYPETEIDCVHGLNGALDGKAPISHTKDKTNPHGVTAEQAGALPITGGNLTGKLTVGSNSVGNKVEIWSDTEGGNIRLYSPDGKTTDFWEMDASYGERFRIFAYKNATHANGAGYVMPLYVHSDGSIEVSNTSKTRERLGVAPATQSTASANCYYRTVDGVTEWINPPMVLGTAYRTTKRYNGKVVYAKLVDCGYMPNASTKVVEITGATRIISAEGVTWPSLQKVPTQSYENWIGNVISLNYTGTYNVAITTSGDYSKESATLLVEYIKD